MSNIIQSKKSETVKVVLRCRPMLEDEISRKCQKVVKIDTLGGVVHLTDTHAKGDEVKREFTYDAVYDANSKQMDLYDETFRPIVDAVLQGYNGTVFAYGQTGTGKTFTMEGVLNDTEKRGVIPNSFEHIFTHISRTEDEHYLIRASYLEIYLDDIYDLLSKQHKKKLVLRERADSGVYVKDLSSFVAKGVKEIEHAMRVGNKNRAVGRTAMNVHSSRSHAIFIVTIECSAIGIDGKNHIRAGKLNLVDLAGSERQSKTESAGDQFIEATKINLSLSSLGNVISALVDGKSSHIPYRDSKLTRLLQDSLGGNTKTVMIANVGPADYNYEETLTTLRYASRAKSITNKPRINEDPKDALLREYQEEIARLKTVLDKRKNKEWKKQRHSIVSEDGSSVDVSESGSENSVKEGPDSFQAQQDILNQEKRAVMHNKELLDEEREKLLSEVLGREELLKKEQKKSDQLASKIEAMESKLLAGNIMDRSDEAKKALEMKHQEVIEQKRREREIKQQLKEKEESTLEMKETFSSLQEEIDIKTKKLDKLKARLKSACADIADYKEEYITLREQLAYTLASLQQEQKLRCLIIDNFIAPTEAEKVTNRAVYREEEEDWILRPIQSLSKDVELRPISNTRSLYPVTKAAAESGDPRFMAENILKVELEMPNRTTQDFVVHSMSSRMRAMLDDHLANEEMVIDASRYARRSGDSLIRSDMPRKGRKKHHMHQNLISSNPSSRSSSKKNTHEHTSTAGTDVVGSSHSTSSYHADEAGKFPTSRGLVSKPIRFA